MHLIWCALVAVSLSACQCKDKQPPAPAQLTEQDVEPHDGGLSGPSWTLALPPTWVSVRAASRERLKPDVEAWALDPAGPTQLTVSCRRDQVVDPLATLQAELAPSAKVPRDGLTVTRVEGPWVEGAVARWAGAEGVHAFARLQLVTATCDVHGWGPKVGGLPADALATLVLRFSSDRPRFMSELGQLTAFLREHPSAQQRHAALVDAGYLDVAGAILMGNALVRLAPDRLARRFSMRRDLLAKLDDHRCAGVVRKELDPLTLLDDAEAAEWVVLTREALTLAMSADGPPVLPTKVEVENAISDMADGDEALSSAVRVLRGGDRAPDDELCAAEKARIDGILAQPADRRLILMKSLVGDR